MANDYFGDFSIKHKNGDFVKDDLSTGLAVNRGYVLDFFHIPTGKHVAFKAMVNSFDDQYTSEWSSENVYGRMDPISQFQGTQRVISLDWDVVAGSVEEAKRNMKKCQTLMSMLYPTYEASAGGSSATLITTAPLFKFKFGNFAMDASKGTEAAAARAEQAGLVGYIGGFTFTPDFESGIMEDIDGTFGEDVSGMGHFFPQHVKLSCEFTVLHTHKLGWEGSEKRDPLFPYGVVGGDDAVGGDESPGSSELEDWMEAIGMEIGGP
tara:strand:+ start:7543 stop:8337 length:795 start_codon:yes stop_codon:yes gene_type:complete